VYRNSRTESRARLLRYLAKRIEEDLSGNGNSDDVDRRPSAKFSIGLLSPQTPNFDPRLKGKLAPSTQGLVFHLPREISKDHSIRVNFKGAVYYRIYPGYKEQASFSGSHVSTKTTKLLTRFRKKSFEFVRDISLLELVKRPRADLPDFDEEFAAIWREAEQDPLFFRPFSIKGRNRASSNIPTDALASETDFENFLQTSKKQDFDSTWQAVLLTTVSDTDTGHKMNISVENTSPETRGDFRENAIFECKLTVQLHGLSFQPFNLEYLEEDYKHNRKILAYGVNCTAASPRENTIHSEHVPVHVEKRTSPLSPECLAFQTLLTDPVRGLQEAATIIEQRIKKLESNPSTDWNERQNAEFKKDIGSARQELERFVRGIELLRIYEDAKSAFSWMSEAFQLSSKGIAGWRLFQAVFIVSVIPDLVSRDHPEVVNSRDHVDLLYFPTGSGKTEAFLGLAIFQAFYDRLNGKSAGVTALSKFPLRMLSIQQLQRIADAFAAAEIVRLKHATSFPTESEPFTIGYYVGERNTPNDLDDWDDATRTIQLTRLKEWEKDPVQVQRFLVISRCPFCGRDGVKIKADPIAIRLYHWCGNEDCSTKGPLPIFITDNEIYRYLPTFVVSTLDKMVTCGFQKKFRNIFGQVSYRCKDHGYTSEPHCTVRYCKARPNELVPCQLLKGVPSLMIQDELHLVRDALGCFASHYETFLDKFARQVGSQHEFPKIIGATATASNFKEHIEQLYQKPAIKFPVSTEIFSDYEDSLARLTLGVMPHGKTAEFVIERILIVLKSELERLSKGVGTKGINGVAAGPEFLTELQDFQTVLSYHIRKSDAELLNRSLWTRVNPRLSELGVSSISNRSLTGDVGFDEIREVMGLIEDGEKKTIGLLTATSLISHGVDLNRLNLMTFMGMPSNNAEYLQARSRVARKGSGLVVVVFMPGRERDHSYYRYFEKFHELHDLMIEPIPINRWAPLAVDRTSVGIFSASIYNYFDLDLTRRRDRPIWKVEKMRQALAEKLLSQEEITNFILDSYGVNKLQGTARDYLENILKTNVDGFISTIITTDEKWRPISWVLEPPPLRSLRDVGTDVAIELNTDSRAIVEGFKINVEKSGAI